MLDGNGDGPPHTQVNPLKTSNLRPFISPLSGATHPSIPPHQKKRKNVSIHVSLHQKRRKHVPPSTCPSRALPHKNCQLLIAFNFQWAIPRVNLIARWKWGWSTPDSGNPLKTSNLRIFINPSFGAKPRSDPAPVSIDRKRRKYVSPSTCLPRRK